MTALTWRSVAAWLAIVVPLWIVFILCTAWEPVMRDGWGHVSWHRNVPISFHAVYDFAKSNYVHNNPRLGQVATYLMFTPGPWHSIVTPLVELGVLYALTALALGRRPSLRSTDDALLFLTITAIVLVCVRSVGPMLFYRPFTGNYVFGLFFGLVWLLPYRFHAAEPRRRNVLWVPAMLILGAAAGMSNEHTGPAFVAAGVLALVVFARRGEWFVPWAIAGVVGVIAGGLALFFAPGQEFRYNGLANQQSTLDRIAERGLHANGKIIVLIAIYLLPALVWLVLGVVGRIRSRMSNAEPGQPRERAVAELVGIALALLIVLTLLASPKQGDRLYFAPVCLAAASIGGWVLAQAGRIERIVAAVGGALVVAFVLFKLVTVYHTAHVEFAARMAAIERGAPGTVVTVPHYSQKRSRWILGDDFEVPSMRSNLAAVYNLAGIELAK